MSGSDTAHLRVNEKFDQLDEYREEKIEYIRSSPKFKAEWAEVQQRHAAMRQQAVADARKVVCTVSCGAVTLKLTLTEKFLLKQFSSSVVEPFLKAFNKSTKRAPGAASVEADELIAVLVDGNQVDMRFRTTDLLLKGVHLVTLLLPQRLASA